MTTTAQVTPYPNTLPPAGARTVDDWQDIGVTCSSPCVQHSTFGKPTSFAVAG
jgi:hypothetical protein